MTEHDAKQNMSLVTQEMPPPGDAPDVQEPLQAPPLCCTAARFLPSLSLAVSFITPPTSSSPSRHPPPPPPPPSPPAPPLGRCPTHRGEQGLRRGRGMLRAGCGERSKGGGEAEPAGAARRSQGRGELTG